MKDLFNKDITIKIVSVLIAILAWLAVLNTSNPYETETFHNIPLTVENENFLEENNYVLKNQYKNSIDITIRGRRDVIRRVRDRDFEAILDFSQIKSANDRYLEITGPFCNVKDVDIVHYNPDRIEIILSRVMEKTFPVTLESNISTKAGYSVLEVTSNVNTVKLEGEEVLLNSVDKVIANVELKNLDRDVTAGVNCTVLNKEGKEIRSLSKNLSVDVSVRVAKRVPVDVTLSGSPANNFVVKDQTLSPNFAYITGEPNAVEKIEKINTKIVNIKDISTDLNATTELVLPEGVKLAPETPKEFKVFISLERIVAREIDIDYNDISILNGVTDGSYLYRIKPENLTVHLTGRESILDALNINTLNPRIDVENLTEGTHMPKLLMKLPDHVSAQETFVELEIIVQQGTGDE